MLYAKFKYILGTTAFQYLEVRGVMVLSKSDINEDYIHIQMSYLVKFLYVYCIKLVVQLQYKNGK